MSGTELMSDEQGYNGWKNFETWAMALWIDNDQGSYAQSREMAASAKHTANVSHRTAEGLLADSLKEWMTDEATMPDLGATVWADLLGSAVQSVDWYEIAENYLSELA